MQKKPQSDRVRICTQLLACGPERVLVPVVVGAICHHSGDKSHGKT